MDGSGAYYRSKKKTFVCVATAADLAVVILAGLVMKETAFDHCFDEVLWLLQQLLTRLT